MTLASPILETEGRKRLVSLWTGAALVILGAHATAGWIALSAPVAPLPPTGVPEAPILIELEAPPAPPPAAPAAAVEAPPVEEPPAEVPPEPVVEPPPPEPVVEPEPIPEPEPVVEPEPEPMVEEEPEPVVEPEPEPEPVVEEAPAPPEVVANVPLPMARPTPPRPRPERTAEARPRPPREEPVRERPRRQERRQQAQQPPSQASQASRQAATSQGATSRPSVSPARWQSQVLARINRFKRTPRGGGTGIVQISFTVAASGQAGGIRVSRSSGNPVLDEAALSLVRRASPFPAPPQAGISVTVPIDYRR